jgi:exoribonuclease-2
MHFIYEEGGEIKGATAIGASTPSADNHAAQTQFGKRIKLKAKDVWYSWTSTDLDKNFLESQAIAQEIDMDFLWECAPEEEFKFADIAKDYFGEGVQATQIIALAMALQAAPIYFRRKGRGQFMRAPEEQLKAALASVERKRKEAQLQQEWEVQMLGGQLPEGIAQLTQQLLWAPDKNGIAYKAIHSVSHQQGINPAQLLLQLGAIHSPLEIHQGKFLKEYFSKGIGFAAEAVVSEANWQKIAQELPTAEVKAFSIDDASTTEIDDAFSVTALPDKKYQIGIHIAAPGLAMVPGDVLDQIARKRMSTVYFPGGKITMLPSSVIDIFSLEAGGDRPAISLYLTVDENGDIDTTIPPRSAIEQVFVQRNLRLGEIEHLIDEESIEDPARDDILYRQELSILWRAAQKLHGQRQQVRVAAGQREEKLGPPEPGSLARDFNFEIQTQDGNKVSPEDLLSAGLDDQTWRPIISSRQRGSVIDSIVAEWMIYSNQTWGSVLAQNDLPAIYRAQQGWGAQRTRMQTTPCRHEGLGVENYAWCTSPLRRYADLVNQWQLIAYIKQGVMAKLAAPFVPKDTKIMALCAEFDATYTAYNTYQQIAEKYWCLRYLQTQGLPWNGVVRVQKEGMVRVEPIPLRLQVPELQQAPRGARVEVSVMSVDLLLLTASVRVVQILDQQSEVLDTQTELEEEIIEPVVELITETLPDQSNDSTATE